MSITAKMYGQTALTLADKLLDWNSDTVKCVLLTNTYTPNQDTHTTYAHLETSANETSGTGYATGGVTLTACSAAYTASSNETILNADDAAWTTASFTARTAVVYSLGTTASNSYLWGYFQFSADETVAAGTFTIQWHATDGLFKITAS